MRAIKTLITIITINLVAACDKAMPEEIPRTVIAQQALGMQGKQSATAPLPEFLTSVADFKHFVARDDLSTFEKYAHIRDFFSNIHWYDKSQVIDAYALIGSSVEWDVDWISQFKNEMAMHIAREPKILCDIANRLSNNQMAHFSSFYLGNAIWVDEFPEALYTLKTCNRSQFNVAIDAYYQRYLAAFNTHKMLQSYLVNDKDGKTNLRARPSTVNSAINAVINNGQKVLPLWREGDWLFVKTDNEVGYVHLKNLSEGSTFNLNNAVFDFNQDGRPDKIILTQASDYNESNFNITIHILKSTAHSYQKIAENMQLLEMPNNGCVLDGLQEIWGDKDKLHIIYDTCADRKFVTKYLSFVFDKSADDFILTENKMVFDHVNGDGKTYLCDAEPVYFVEFDGLCHKRWHVMP